MNLLSAEQVSKNYGIKTLFHEITLHIDEGERIGLIGINGTGKSTLFRVIAGAETPDEGRITTANGLTVAYLPQNPLFNPEATVLQQAFIGDSPLLQLLYEYESTVIQQSKEPNQESLQQQLADLRIKLEAENALQLYAEAKKILSKLGIDQYMQQMKELSGGQRKRVLLAAILLHPADLIILDEPTNHLDTEAVDWLESYLKKSSSSLLMITHDRYFLDRVTNRIIELDQGKLYSYKGNYSYFLDKKTERMEKQQASEQKRQNLLRNELEWIRRGAKARTTKQKARIDRFEQLQDAKPAQAAGDVDISLAGSRLGKKVIELSGVSKSFADRTLIRDFSYIVQKQDRIGII